MCIRVCLWTRGVGDRRCRPSRIRCSTFNCPEPLRRRTFYKRQDHRLSFSLGQRPVVGANVSGQGVFKNEPQHVRLSNGRLTYFAYSRAARCVIPT
eukprot:1190680-Prorocentrum_minimum.AAC.4